MKNILQTLTIWILLLGCFTINVNAQDDSLVSNRFNLKYYGDGGYILLPNEAELKNLNKQDHYYVYDFVVEDDMFKNTDVALTVYEPLASEIDYYEQSPSISQFDEIKKDHEFVLKPQGSDYQYIWAYGDIKESQADYTIDIINNAKNGYYTLTLQFKSESLSPQDIQNAQNLVEAIVDNSSYVN